MSKEVGFAKKKYADLIRLGKEALDLVKIPFEVRKAEKDLEKEIIILATKLPAILMAPHRNSSRCSTKKIINVQNYIMIIFDKNYDC